MKKYRNKKTGAIVHLKRKLGNCVQYYIFAPFIGRWILDGDSKLKFFKKYEEVINEK